MILQLQLPNSMHIHTQKTTNNNNPKAEEKKKTQISSPQRWEFSEHTSGQEKTNSESGESEERVDLRWGNRGIGSRVSEGLGERRFFRNDKLDQGGECERVRGVVVEREGEAVKYFNF